MEVSVEKPGSPEELVHAGVKGMKWGVRRSREQFRANFPTSGSKASEIRRARTAVKKQERDIVLAQTPAKRQKLTEAYLKNPDRATALRLTRGEKVVGYLIAGPIAGPLTGGLALPVAGGFAGYRYLKRRGIEKTLYPKRT